MQTVTLGKTGLTVSKNSFGALPIQRVDENYASMLLNKAYDAGINYFDTARAYSDSEEKIGKALSDKRDKIVISTKTMATDADGFFKDLETSLTKLKTDYIDIYQFHTPAFCPKPGGADGLYDAMTKAIEQGKVRFAGITNHRLPVAKEAVESGLYATLQFPFCYISSDEDIALASLAKEHDMGFIAMKALAGGLINNSGAAYAFVAQFDNVVPIWGVQRETELDEFISYIDNPPAMNAEYEALIAKDKAELSGNFCRSCGYCMSECPEGIQINQCARMSQMIRRAPSEVWLGEYWQAEMKKIENCRNCGKCKKKCPYGLDTPALLKKNYEDYKTFFK